MRAMPLVWPGGGLASFIDMIVAHIPNPKENSAAKCERLYSGDQDGAMATDMKGLDHTGYRMGMSGGTSPEDAERAGAAHGEPEVRSSGLCLETRGQDADSECLTMSCCLLRLHGRRRVGRSRADLTNRCRTPRIGFHPQKREPDARPNPSPRIGKWLATGEPLGSASLGEILELLARTCPRYLMVYTVKKYHRPDCNAFDVFGRVMSGTLFRGDRVKIFGEASGIFNAPWSDTVTICMAHVSGWHTRSPQRIVQPSAREREREGKRGGEGERGQMQCTRTLPEGVRSTTGCVSAWGPALVRST